MSIKTIAITTASSIVVLAVIVSGTWFGSKAYYDRQKPPVEITKQLKTTTQVTKTPDTPAALNEWKFAKVKITGKMKGNQLLVTSNDGFKKAETIFELKARVPDFKKNVILLNYIGVFGFGHSDLTFSHGAKLEYYRMLIPWVGIGGGIFSTNREMGVAVGLIIQI